MERYSACDRGHGSGHTFVVTGHAGYIAMLFQKALWTLKLLLSVVMDEVSTTVTPWWAQLKWCYCNLCDVIVSCSEHIKERTADTSTLIPRDADRACTLHAANSKDTTRYGGLNQKLTQAFKLHGMWAVNGNDFLRVV